MNYLFVKLHNKEIVKIDKSIFVDLLDISHIKEYKKYTTAIETNSLTLKSLKELAIKAATPYPLFFAPREIVDKQINEKNKKLEEKIPTKEEIRLTSRGHVEIKDIELIIKDLGRKQEFLKNRVLVHATTNNFIGSLAANFKKGHSPQQLAKQIREFLEIDLGHLRSISKEKVLAYITSRAESKGILVSFSSYNYMPQNIDPELTLSGICIKDKKFPFIFINTRDGDDKPKIIESSGRQIFTLLSMITCIGLNQFLLSSKATGTKGDLSKIAYKIAAEIIIPKIDLTDIRITTLEGLKEKAHFFRITPSMLLYQLKQQNKIKALVANEFRKQLQHEAGSIGQKRRNPPLPTTAYGKYNGERFSREIMKAYRNGAIPQIDVKNILFRQGKMDTQLLNEYSKKYR